MWRMNWPGFFISGLLIVPPGTLGNLMLGVPWGTVISFFLALTLGLCGYGPVRYEEKPPEPTEEWPQLS